MADYSYSNELANYDANLNAYVNSAETLWAAKTQIEEIPSQILTEVAGPLGVEYTRSAIDKYLESNSFKGLKAKVGRVGSRIKGILEDKADSVVNRVKAFGTDALEKASDTVEGLKSTATDLAEGLAGKAQGLVQGLATGGRALGDAKGLAQTAVDTAESTGDALTGTLDNVKSGLPANYFTLEYDPSTFAGSGEFEAPESFGRFLAPSEDAVGDALGSLNRLANAVPDLASTRKSMPSIRDAVSRMRQQALTRNAREAPEFETGDYSLMQDVQTPRTVPGGLLQDALGNVQDAAQKVLRPQGAVSVAQGSVELQEMGTNAKAGLNSVGEAANTLAEDVASKFQSNITAIKDLTGASQEVAASAIEEGASAIRGGTELLDSAGQAIAGEAGAAASDIAETLGGIGGEIAAATGEETGGIGAAIGALVGLGGLVAGIVTGSEHSEPTVNIPNYSEPVYGPGL